MTSKTANYGPPEAVSVRHTKESYQQEWLCKLETLPYNRIPQAVPEGIHSAGPSARTVAQKAPLRAYLVSGGFTVARDQSYVGSGSRHGLDRFYTPPLEPE